MRDWRQVIVTVSMTHRRPHHVHAYGANKTPHYTTGDKNLDKLLTPTGFAGMLSTCCTLKATWRTCEAPSFGWSLVSFWCMTLMTAFKLLWPGCKPAIVLFLLFCLYREAVTGAKSHRHFRIILIIDVPDLFLLFCLSKEAVTGAQMSQSSLLHCVHVPTWSIYRVYKP